MVYSTKPTRYFLYMPVNKSLLNQSHYLPNSLLPWLTHVQSLTQKLRQVANEANLEIVRQEWEKTNEWDEAVLTLIPQNVFHRDIAMYAHHQPCWFARTILPKATYDANMALFARLEQETLGDLIFKGKEIQRVSIDQFMIDDASTPYEWLTTDLRCEETKFWARLSEFSVNHQGSFFLLEILLPPLLRYCD